MTFNANGCELEMY